ncbi:hypothetical protein MJA45_14630 [Paenibacillus aurantius]|uniref:Uncharacterized protein n=1 Tax=Paenibacillus aurantius TaxID=2918900 RepID=A0AA96L8B2_9BACL|nr:hypothetical protein [Paenibacillus aurantius]WNQ08886.1 hypothetical protein MJA45_14630 [Paenibacillus aurantius]
MITNRDYFPTVILGATFAGLGAAYANEESLVMERTSFVGHEFINSFHPGVGWHETALTEKGMKLKQELMERGVMSDEGSVHIPAVAPILYNKIIQDSLSVLLQTEVTEIVSAGNSWEVTVYNNSGFRRIKTDRVIDTRPEMAPTELLRSKSLNALLNCGEEELVLPEEIRGQAHLVKGKLKGEIILKFPVDVKDDWFVSRQKLHQFWVNRPEAWKAWTISAISGCFEWRHDQGEPASASPGRVSLPSSAYRNPLEAFEAGLAAGRGK